MPAENRIKNASRTCLAASVYEAFDIPTCGAASRSMVNQTKPWTEFRTRVWRETGWRHILRRCCNSRWPLIHSDISFFSMDFWESNKKLLLKIKLRVIKSKKFLFRSLKFFFNYWEMCWILKIVILTANVSLCRNKRKMVEVVEGS